MTPATVRIAGSPDLCLLDWGGGGIPLLLLHGMGGNAHWWDAVAPRLLAGYRPLALDFRGHGDSAWAADGHYDPEGFSADIEAARVAMGAERLVLAGHSLGARVAVGYAADRANAVLGLIAVDFLPETDAAASRRFLRARAAPQPAYRDAEQALARFRLEPRGTLLDGAALRRLGETCIRPARPDGGGDAGGVTWKFDWRAFQYRYEPVWPLLPDLRMPALFVRGGRSATMSAEDLRRVALLLPAAWAVEIPPAHHHVPLDAPRELAAEMNRFLETRLRPFGARAPERRA